MLFISIIIIMLLGYVSLSITKSTLQNRAMEFSDAILKRNAYEINQQIEVVTNLTEAISQDVLYSYDQERLLNHLEPSTEYLDQMANSVKIVAELSASKSAYLILVHQEDQNKIGDVIWYSDLNNDGIPERVKGNGLLNRIPPTNLLQSKRSAVTTWFVDQVTRRSLMCIRPIVIDNQLVAFCGVDMNYDGIRNRLNATRYLDTGFVYLTEGNGTILYHPKLKMGQRSDINNIKSDTTQFTYTTNRVGKKTITGSLKMLNEWVLNVELLEDEVLSGLDNIKHLVYLTMGGTLVIVLALGVYAGGIIGKPYIYISKQIEEIGNGNYDVVLDEVHLKRHDEAGVLTRTVDLMRVQQKEMNQNLENLVQQRTEELIHTNQMLEEVLAQTEEQQEKLIETEKIASLSYLVVGIAHQINTPLGNAITSTSYLEEQLKLLNERFGRGQIKKSELEYFLQEGMELSQSISHYLDVSRNLVDKFKGLDSIKDSAYKTEINLKRFVLDQLDIFSKRYNHINCKHTVEIPDQLEMICDPLNLQKIFFELIDNSYEHAFDENAADDQAEIIIHIKEIPKTSEKGKGFFIQYADNGKGVNREIIAQLFTPFYTTKMGKKHYGLGLNMVYNVVLGVFKGEIHLVESFNAGLSYNMTLYEGRKENA